MRALSDQGHATPTQIQAAAIPALLKGRDLIGIAQTGSGKTAAFALPILHHLAENKRRPRPGACQALILTPTRELAAQVLERCRAYGAHLGIRTGLVIGGVSVNKQKAMVRNGVSLIVATPGRLVDLLDQGALTLSDVECFVLDEVDQMLDLGFIHAIRKIASALPQERRNIFFSATMPREIEKLAKQYLRDPVRVDVEPAEKRLIEEGVIQLDPAVKLSTLKAVVSQPDFVRGLVFTRTKRGADKVARALSAAGKEAHAIHGNRSQGQRERALNAFRNGRSAILVATDIAARGIDVTGVSHVVNYDLPNVPETYVHRIGRTGRAGATGMAISFCTPEERDELRRIEKLTGRKIARLEAPSAARAAEPEPRAPVQKTAPRNPDTTNVKAKEKNLGERRTHRNGRRRNRGAAGRQLQSAAG